MLQLLKEEGMEENIDYVDGRSKTSEQLQHIMRNTPHPIVFTNMIDNWPASKWSLDEFTKLFGDIVTQFKLYRRRKPKYVTGESVTKKQRLSVGKPESGCDDNYKAVVMETDCIYVDSSFKDFFVWLSTCVDDINMTDVGGLEQYPCKEFWCYADYKYMAELFSDCSSVLNAVDWSVFGFPNRNGFQSTLWVGSDEAYTPCHQDTYGTNLVAQIYGIKKWILYPPTSTFMEPTRIPYEESSVFSLANIKSINTHSKSYKIDLKAGEVLFVPKHWWHYVESITPSISINTWLEHENDSHDRLRESLVNLLVYTMKTTDETPIHQWLNPNQALPSSFASCLQLVHLALEDNLRGEIFASNNNIKTLCSSNFLVNCFTDNEVLDKVIDVMVRKMKHKEDLSVT